MLRVIVRTFLEVFPHTRAYLLRLNLDTPVLGLVGTIEPVRYPADWFERRVRDVNLLDQLKPLPLVDSYQLFGSLVAGPAALRAYSQEAPLNTDNHPIVIFDAPRFTLERSRNSFGRLFTLIDLDAADPAELIEAGSASFASSLAGFIAARNIYLRGWLAETEGRQAEAMDAFVRSARLSPHFSTGYAHCLTLAMQQAKSDPAAARALLQRLIEAQPQTPVAQQLLDRLKL